MRNKQYVLDAGGEPVPEPDLLRWGAWFETADRHVADTTLTDADGNAVRVSTVFLGLDHRFGPGPPCSTRRWSSAAGSMSTSGATSTAARRGRATRRSSPQSGSLTPSSRPNPKVTP